MTPPEYAIDDECQQSFADDQEEGPGRVLKAGTKVLLLDGEAAPTDNQNNNAVDSNQVQTVARRSDSPLPSLETSV